MCLLGEWVCLYYVGDNDACEWKRICQWLPYRWWIDFEKGQQHSKSFAWMGRTWISFTSIYSFDLFLSFRLDYYRFKRIAFRLMFIKMISGHKHGWMLCVCVWIRRPDNRGDKNTHAHTNTVLEWIRVKIISNSMFKLHFYKIEVKYWILEIIFAIGCLFAIWDQTRFGVWLDRLCWDSFC